MSATSAPTTLKILLIGPSSGGKTSLLLRYTDDIFDTESSTATIGVDFKTKKVSVRGTPYRLLLFDTAGQERFRTLTSSYYRNAQGVILVYDVSNRDSFLGMEHWFGEVEQYAQAGVVKCLVGAKIDKVSRRAEGEVEGEDDGEGEIGRAVRTAEGRALAERYGALFVEVSSKTRENVRRPFVDVVDKIVESPELLKGGDAGKRRSEGGGVNVTAGQEGDGWGCAC